MLQVTILIFLLIEFSFSANPEVISSSMNEIRTSLNGIDYEYLLFDVVFDQKIYKMNHATCGCVDDTEICFNRTDQVGVVDETGYEINVIEDGEVAMVSLSDEVIYYKYRIDRDGFDCPIIVLDINQDINGVYVYAAFGKIPQDDDFDRYIVNWAQKLMICPEDPNYTFGDLYIAFYRGSPHSSISTASFQVLTFESEICRPYNEVTGIDNIPLYDGHSHSSTVNPENYVFFEMVIESGNECEDLSIYSRGNDPNFPGDFDIFVSLTNPKPTLEEDYTWAGFNDIEDLLVITNICNPDPSGPFVVYISIYAFNSDTMIAFDVTATTGGSFFLDDITKYGSMSYYLSLAFASVKFECGADIFECEFYPFPYGGCFGSPYKCCDKFFPVFPYETGSNPFIVFDVSDFDLSNIFTQNQNFESFPTIPDNTLSFGVLVSKTKGEVYERFLHSDPSECRLTWFNFLVNDNFEPPLGSVQFTQETGNCDTNILADTVADYQDLVSELEITVSFSKIPDLTRLISHIPFRRNWIFCLDLLDTFTIQESILVRSFSNSTTCYQPINSVDYFNDPCCDLNSGLESCCIPAEREVIVTIPIAPNTDKITEECSTTLCVSHGLNAYSSGVKNSFLCSESYDNSLLGKPSALYDCRLAILGTDLGGISCNIDDDCLYSGQCVFGRCVNEIDDLLMCVSENLPPRSRQTLFSQKNIYEEATIERFMSFLNDSYVSNGCISRGSFEHRNHWRYAPLLTFCVDDCTDSPELSCFEQFCEIPEECDFLNQEGKCIKIWRYIENDGGNCLDESYCNWKECTGTQEECEDECFNSTLSEFTCVSCNDGICEEVPGIINEAECTGTCSILTENTQENCLSAGYCSLFCPSCTESECSETMRCSASDLSDIIPFGRDGLCIIPYEYDFFGELTCEGEPFLTGCIVNSSSSECTGTWYTDDLSIDECETTYFYCEDPVLSFTDAECLLCDYPITSLFEIEYGNWISGEWKQHYWVQRSFQSIRRIGPSLDFLTLYDDIERSLIRDDAFFLTSNIYCRFESDISILYPALCDCVNKDDDCFLNISKSRSKILNLCAFLEDTIQVTSNISIQIYRDTLPASFGCDRAEFSVLSILPFKIEKDYYLSSAFFSEPRKNDYSVIMNSNKINVGQLVHEGVSFITEKEFTGIMTICFSFDDTDFDIHESHKVPGLVKRMDQDFEIITTTENSGEFCFEINGTGSYYPVFLTEDWEVASSYTTGRIIVIILYLICLLLSVVQFVCSKIYQPDIMVIPRFFIFLFLVILCSTRAIFMSFDFTDVGYSYALFEGPSILFFSEYTVLFYNWIEIIIRARQLRRKIRLRFIYIGVIILNIILFVTFLVFVLLFSLWPKVEIEQCAETEITIASDLFTLNRIYLLILAALSGLFAITFLIFGGIMMNTFNFLHNSAKKRHAMIIIGTVTTIFTLIVIPRLIIYIYFSWNEIVFPVLLFGIMETGILLTLIFYLYPEKILVCCAVSDSDSSVVKLSSSISKQKSSGSQGTVVRIPAKK